MIVVSKQRTHENRRAREDENLHIASNAWIPVDPPSAPYSSLAFEDAELVKAEDLFEATAHRDAGHAGPHYKHWVVRVGILVIAIDSPNRLALHIGKLGELLTTAKEKLQRETEMSTSVDSRGSPRQPDFIP